jgi:hypothetical protein
MGGPARDERLFNGSAAGHELLVVSKQVRWRDRRPERSRRPRRLPGTIRRWASKPAPIGAGPVETAAIRPRPVEARGLESATVGRWTGRSRPAATVTTLAMARWAAAERRSMAALATVTLLPRRGRRTRALVPGSIPAGSVTERRTATRPAVPIQWPSPARTGRSIEAPSPTASGAATRRPRPISRGVRTAATAIVPSLVGGPAEAEAASRSRVGAVARAGRVERS